MYSDSENSSDWSDVESNYSSDDDGKRRIIGMLDVDSFECQIWLRKYPHFKGHPCVVADNTGRILSVSIEAKREGISRMKHRLRRAKSICPRLHVFRKPNRYNKPDCEETRVTSWELTDIIKENLKGTNIIIETVPSDQWYFDLTDYVQGCDRDERYALRAAYMKRSANLILEVEDEQFRGNQIAMFLEYSNVEEKIILLLKAAKILSNLADRIYEKTGFSCSGGVSANLLLAKIACNLNKPGKITALNEYGLNRISPKIPIQSVQGFGKKLGKKIIDTFGINSLHQLQNITFSELQEYFPRAEAIMIANSARGICEVPVIHKTATQVVGCGKYKLDINSNFELRCELDDRCEEMLDRLDAELSRYKRVPKSLKLEIQFHTKSEERPVQHYSEEFSTNYYRLLSVSDLAQECFEEIVKRRRIDLYNSFTITALKFTAKSWCNAEYLLHLL